METREVFVFPPPCLSLLPAVVRGAGPSFFILLFSWSASFLLQLRSLFFLHFLLYLVVGFCFFFLQRANSAIWKLWCLVSFYIFLRSTFFPICSTFVPAKTGSCLSLVSEFYATI